MTDEEQKKIFSRNLTHYINESGKMQKDIAKDLGVPIQTFNGWCKEVSIPNMGKVQKLADYFHIGKSDLLDNREDYVFAINDEEKIIIECYRTLKDDQKEMTKRLLMYDEKIRELSNKNNERSEDK